MKAIILVFVGGGLGSALRFLLGRWIAGLYHHSFPLGTLMVNVSACLVLGILIGLADHRQMLTAHSRLFWTVGFCGGFSTFSAFSQETFGLLQNGFMATSVLYVGLSLVLCLGATYLGVFLGSQ